MLGNCGKDEKAPAGAGTAVADVAADDAGPMQPPVQALPPDEAKEVAALLEKEQAWLVRPPADLTPEQLDQQFADLRWEISEKLGLNDVRGAISYGRASLDLDPAHATRWERLGDLLQLSGELTSARYAADAYDNAVFLAPQSKTARRKLIAALLMLKQ
ncbi:MAG TPA: hypothetical protein PLB55_25245, partial [Prosthecobacter sp.]|nr:hypothetical protein [Prosthecobacter sp.]